MPYQFLKTLMICPHKNRTACILHHSSTTLLAHFVFITLAFLLFPIYIQMQSCLQDLASALPPVSTWLAVLVFDQMLSSQRPLTALTHFYSVFSIAFIFPCNFLFFFSNFTCVLSLTSIRRKLHFVFIIPVTLVFRTVPGTQCLA